MRSDLDSLSARTQAFAIRVVCFVKTQPPNFVDRPILEQLVRAATSVSANQRSARRAQSDRDLLKKLSIVNEEADAAVPGLEVLHAVAPEPMHTDLAALLREARELRAIFATGRKTMRRRVEERIVSR